MCTSKRPFLKEGKAIDFVIAAERRGAMVRGRVYRCPVCLRYHITSQGAGTRGLAAAG